MFTITIITITLITAYLINRRQRSNVPRVSGALPFVGHGLQYTKDPMKFIKNSYEKYGPVFEIQLFRKPITIVCDHSLVKEFFDAKEEELSMYETFSDHYFDRAFSKEPNILPFFIECIKQTVPPTFRAKDFSPIMREECNNFIERLRSKMINGKLTINLEKEVIRLVTFSLLKYFVGISPDENLYQDIMTYIAFVNKLASLTYLLPKWLIIFLYDKQLIAHREKVTNYLETIIQDYVSTDKKDSMMIRKAVDYTGGWNYDKSNEQLTPQQIANIIMSLIYVSIANTSYALIGLLIDGGSNKEEIMESVRFNSHIFGVNRKPGTKKTLGQWNLTGTVALCPAMLMRELDTVYKDGNNYNPGRFDNEPIDKYNIITWGAGTHFCPGKMFAVTEMEIVAKMFQETFDIKLPVLPERDYITPSSFAIRSMDIELLLKE